MSTTIALQATKATWISAYRAANLLARAGFSPLWATTPFAGVSSSGSQTEFERGSIVLEAGDAEALGGIDGLRARLGVDAIELSTTEGFEGRAIRPIRIAIYGGGGAPYNHAAAFGELGFLVEFVFPEDILAGALSEFDVIAVPGGGNRAMLGQLDPLGDAGCRAIAEFVRGGGMYLGSCAGAYDASLVSDSFLEACPQQRHMQMINAAVWNTGDEWLGIRSPGVGILHARIARSDHPVTFGMPEQLDVTHYNGPFYRLRQNVVGGASDAIGLMEVAGVGTDFTPAERFLGAVVPDRDLLVTEAAASGAFNAVAGEFGRGRVVLFGSHPEFGLGLDLEAWGGPARLMANAAFWQSNHAGVPRTDRLPRVSGDRSASPHASLQLVATRLDAIVQAAERLLSRDSSEATWLTDALAMSTFGLPAAEIWQRNLSAFRPTSERMRSTISALEEAAKEAGRLTHVVGGPPSIALRAAIDGLNEAIYFRTPPEWNIDVGYEGVLQQLDRAEAMLKQADASFDKGFAPDANAYAYLLQSPFHLAVGSYLSAIGIFADAYLLLRLHRSQLENAIAFSMLEPQAVHGL